MPLTHRASMPAIGPEVDTTPRPLPARVPIRGRYVTLEPLHRRHVDELWQAAQGADESWTYLGAGPFASAEAMARQVMDLAATHDPMLWAVRPVTTGVVSGWLALMDIQPQERRDRTGQHLVQPAHAAHARGHRGDLPDAEAGRRRSGLSAAGVEMQRPERAIEAGGRTPGLHL